MLTEATETPVELTDADRAKQRIQDRQDTQSIELKARRLIKAAGRGSDLDDINMTIGLGELGFVIREDEREEVAARALQLAESDDVFGKRVDASTYSGNFPEGDDDRPRAPRPASVVVPRVGTGAGAATAQPIAVSAPAAQPRKRRKVTIDTALRNEIRDFVRDLRADDPDIESADVRVTVEKRFNVEITRSNWSVTYWRKTTPEEVIADDEVEPVQPAEETETEPPAFSVDLLDDGGMHLVLSASFRPDIGGGLIASIGHALAAQRLALASTETEQRSAA